jgi:hypothetical protein
MFFPLIQQRSQALHKLQPERLLAIKEFFGETNVD